MGLLSPCARVPAKPSFHPSGGQVGLFGDNWTWDPSLVLTETSTRYIFFFSIAIRRRDTSINSFKPRLTYCLPSFCSFLHHFVRLALYVGPTLVGCVLGGSILVWYFFIIIWVVHGVSFFTDGLWSISVCGHNPLLFVILTVKCSSRTNTCSCIITQIPSLLLFVLFPALSCHY